MGQKNKNTIDLGYIFEDQRLSGGNNEDLEKKSQVSQQDVDLPHPL